MRRSYICTTIYSIHTVALAHPALGVHVIGHTAGSDFEDEFRRAFEIVICRDP
jgi:hypothetical protein